MGLKAWFYAAVATPHTVAELFEFLMSREIEISWAVEAGCHDASDTESMATLFNLSKIYAFEPDPYAFGIAEDRLQKFQGHGVDILLSNGALAAVDGEARIHFIGEPGSESTQILDNRNTSNEFKVATLKLDSLNIPEASAGLLWLDVEGNAVSALKGMRNTLPKFSVAKIEVEFHDMSSSRLENFKEVIKLLTKANLQIVKADCNPGYFGDILFIKKELLNLKGKINSRLIKLALFALHGNIYPILRKPKKLV